MNNYVIDVDGTICEELGESYTYMTVPAKVDLIKKINELYDAGSKITLFTARGMRTFSGDIEKINGSVRPILVDWLQRNGVKYTELVMGKPWHPNVYYIDDRNLTPQEFLEKH
jgi:capsule biosynthesis phosphatase